MKHYLRFLITMLLLVLFGGGSFGQTWQKVELKDLTSDDVFVIVDVLNNRAISNATVGKNNRPAAVSVTLNEAGDRLTGVVVDNLKWKVTSNGGDYIFTSNASSNNILYWTGNSTDLKVGTLSSDAKKKEYHKFNEYTSDIYTGLKTKKETRYICNYKNQDWRCYSGPNGSYLTDNKTKLAYFKYVKDAKTPTNVSFGADVDGKTYDVNEGEEASFFGKTATEKGNVAGSIKYTSDKSEIVAVDGLTGALTFNKTKTFGKATITALFTPADATTYAESSASYIINYKVIGPNTIVFSVADGSFENVGSYTETQKVPDVVFVSASGENYTFNLTQCMKATDAKHVGCLQMKSDKGVVKSPSFDAFPNGYKVTVYYTVNTGAENLTITSKELPGAASTTVGTGDDRVTTISLPLSTAKFILTANGYAKWVSKIELTPLAAPKIETVVLDEKNNNDKVVEDYAGKTVNVTLKRTISDTYLNPFCVPFDMTADQITAVFGEGSVVSAFTSVTGKVMNFEKVATITAGQPYIVQATKASTEISLDNVEMKLEPGSNVKQNSSELSMSFNGIVSPYTFKKNDGTELFLDKNGNLRYPSTVGSQMKGMRAYFEVLDGTGNEAKVNIGGGLSSVDKLMNGEAMTGKVYNLNGQYVGNTLDGLAKGLYIMNGKKYVVK